MKFNKIAIVVGIAGMVLGTAAGIFIIKPALADTTSDKEINQPSVSKEGIAPISEPTGISDPKPVANMCDIPEMRLKIDLQEGWTCELLDKSERWVAYKIKGKYIDITIANNPIGFECMPEEGAQCEIVNFYKKGEISVTLMKEDGFTYSVFGAIQDDPYLEDYYDWFSVKYDGIGERDMNEQEKAEVIKLVDGISVY